MQKKYTNLALELRRSIESGAYFYGQRLPSLRALARARRLSIATVDHAYRELESQDIIEARPRSGFFVTLASPKSGRNRRRARLSRPRDLGTFQDLMFDILSEPDGSRIVRLGLTQLEPDLVPRDELSQITRQVLRTAGRRLHEYPHPAGVETFRRRICALMHDRGVVVGADDLFVTNGCQEALWIALRCIAAPGQIVAVETPCYPGLLKLLQALNLKALEVPARPREGLDLQVLSNALSNQPVAAIYVMPNCSNPRGDVYPDACKQSLYEMALSHDVPIIEDDANRDLFFGSHALTALKKLDDRGLVLFCSSFSKTVSPAYRVGWLIPGRYAQEALDLKHAINLGAPVESQLVLNHYLGQGRYRRGLQRMKPVLADSVSRLISAFLQECPEAEIERPLGGTFAWIRLPGGRDAHRVRQRALQRGVSIATGAMFSASPSYRDCLRLGWGGAWNARVEGATRLVATMAREDA